MHAVVGLDRMAGSYVLGRGGGEHFVGFEFTFLCCSHALGLML